MKKSGITISGLVLCGAALQAQNVQPNFVIFIADDMGWEESNPYGNTVVHTPNMQRIADEGMRFDNFYLCASSSSPSRACLLSGLYPHNTGAMNLHEDMQASIELVVDKLNAAGYYTMNVGKSHSTNKKEVMAKYGLMDKVNWSKPWEMGDMWVRALQNRPKDKPFFMWAASIDPHRPYKQGECPYRHRPEDVVLPPYYPDIPEIREELADYYDEIGRYDWHIGMAMDELERQGLLENTVIIVMSDNGRPFPQCKIWCNRQGMKSQFIVRYPGMVKAGSSTRSLASAVDFTPTVLDLAGVEKSPQMIGESLVPILKNSRAEVRKYAYGERNWHVTMAFERSVYTERYVYIRNWLPDLPMVAAGEIMPMPAYTRMRLMWEAGELAPEYSESFVAPRAEEELYDIKKDPHCMRNIAGERRYARVLKDMRAQLDKWQAETGDVFPGREKLKQDKIDRRFGGSLNVQ